MVQKGKTAYSDQSIKSLKGADRVRKRPAVIFGSDGLEGCQHSVFEIISNSIDESREGYGREINVTYFADRSIQVEDFGRGVPLDWNEKEKRFNWELVFCELYAGGKYDNQDGGAYEFSLGLNGLGACSTQYSSEFMHVTSYTNHTKYTISFAKGEPKGKLNKEDWPKKRTGTVIHWKPDLEVFTDIDMPASYFISVCKKQAVVNAGLVINLALENPDKTWDRQTFCYENGILDYVRELAGLNESVEETEEENLPMEGEEPVEKVSRVPLSAPMLWTAERTGADRADMKPYKLLINAAVCFTNYGQRIEYYHNSSFLEHGGSPDKAARTAFVKALDTYMRSNNKYGKTEQKITFPDVEDCLILVTSSFSNQTSYANQTKKAITNTFIAEAMTEFFLQRLEVFFAENPAIADKIVAQVLINKRSREDAESARLNLKKKLSAPIDVANNVEKFVGCRSKDPALRELYIVEGDSALTSCKLGRNADFQAIIPVRGKTLNCLKAGYDRIFKSDIIVDLLKVIGCGVEIKTKSNKLLAEFSLDQLKWSKIILCTDADEDGFQIRALLLTLFYRLLPTLIREGRVYIAESPLYEINCGKETKFAYNEAEKTKILESFGDKKYTIQRSKGLGENEPDMMWLTTMNPETRRLLRIMPEDEDETYRMFHVLLGNDTDDIAARKRFISEKSRFYYNPADL